jgi:hypothetical protein
VRVDLAPPERDTGAGDEADGLGAALPSVETISVPTRVAKAGAFGLLSRENRSLFRAARVKGHNARNLGSGILISSSNRLRPCAPLMVIKCCEPFRRTRISISLVAIGK